MIVTKIRVQNFRLLRDISIDLEDELSVIIGKNNCGKTSLLLILDKFIGSGHSKNNFSFDDFNITFKEELKSQIEGNKEQNEISSFMGISLKLFIEYDEDDDLSNIGNKIIMDLDPENRVVVLAFEYVLSTERLGILKRDYKTYYETKDKPKDIFSFLKDHHAVYFQISKKSLQYNIQLQKEDETIFTDFSNQNIPLDKIICFKWISARRNVSNKDTEKALSSQSSKIYKKLEANSNNPAVIEQFKDTLSNTDDNLNKIYEALFQEIINDVKRFGGLKQDDSIIKIVSSLQHQELLEENTTVMYGFESADHSLPENYNGLGYLNLISMIFEIKIKLHEFQKEKSEKPSDINLLFIEEPEAHTHPQMQRIFIKNIKDLLKRGIEREDGENRKLQTILSTHSSHIVSESNFEDIKYFKRITTRVISKNLKDLKKEYNSDNEHYKFLKQYLTLHRSELFFADKVIFIEGDTERILLPAMMKKIDQEDIQAEIINGSVSSIPLLSQNISIIEVGAYSKVFEKFIDFIGLKSLIITDIDSVKSVPLTGSNLDKTKHVSCPVSEGEKTSNSSMKYFYGENESLSYFIELSLSERKLKKNIETGKWDEDPNGHLLCVYQIKEDNNSYHARTFEDAFLHINIGFIKSKVLDEDEVILQNHHFGSLSNKHLVSFFGNDNAVYDLASKGVKSKPSFAMEVLLNSSEEEITFLSKDSGKEVSMTMEFSNWNIPKYIREGLQWLKQD